MEETTDAAVPTAPEAGDVSLDQEEDLDEDTLLYGDSDKLFEEFKNAKQPEKEPVKVRLSSTI